MKDKLYLVTGASWILGQPYLPSIGKKGRSSKALALPGDKSVRYLPPEVEIVEGNICDSDSLRAFFTIPEDKSFIVIHCASMVTVVPDFNQKLIDINVKGTQNILSACGGNKQCTKLVYVGSTGSIPERPKGEPIREVGRYQPNLVVGWYSRSKAMACQEVMDTVQRGELEACIVHPGGIMGPEDFAVGETTRMLIQIIKGEMKAGMQGSFNLCDVRDLAQGCILAADRGRNGESYILGNKEVTLKELCGMLEKETGCAPIGFYLPLGIAKVMARIMELTAKLTGKKPLMTTFAVYNLARNNAFDSTKAKLDLGYTTRPYAETIHDEVQWLIREGKIELPLR